MRAPATTETGPDHTRRHGPGPGCAAHPALTRTGPTFRGRAEHTEKYAEYLNTQDANGGRALELFAAGGNDIETNWGPPGYAMNWMDGYNVESTNGSNLDSFDDGAIFNSCAASGCWNSLGWDKNNWTQADNYYVIWGVSAAYATPEQYNTGWGYYYNDLDKAAKSETAFYGVPQYTGVLWSCGVQGSELSVTHAYTDFANETGQTPTYSMYLHNAANTC